MADFLGQWPKKHHGCLNPRGFVCLTATIFGCRFGWIFVGSTSHRDQFALVDCCMLGMKYYPVRGLFHKPFPGAPYMKY